MITLLILFMVDTKPPHYHAWYAAHLPSVKHPIAQPNATREDSIRISVTRDGLVFLRDHAIQPQELSGLIREAVKSGSERKAYLAVDARTMYGDVIPVVEQIRMSGVSDLCFLANKSGQPPLR